MTIREQADLEIRVIKTKAMNFLLEAQAGLSHQSDQQRRDAMVSK